MSLEEKNTSKEMKEGEKKENYSEIRKLPKESTNSNIQTNFTNIQIEKIENPTTILKVESPPIITMDIGKQNQKMTFIKPSNEYTTTIITKSNIINNENKPIMTGEEDIIFENIPNAHQNLVGIAFAKDQLNEIKEYNNDNQKNQNIIIKTKYEAINNNKGGNIKNNNNNTIKEAYKKTVVKGGNINNKKNSLKNIENINNHQIIQTIEKKKIINPQSEIIKEITTEKNDENKNPDLQIEKRLTLDNIDAISNNDSSFFENESNRFNYSEMSENRLKRFKSFVSHNSNSTEKIDDIFSSVDFRIQRTKTLKDINISKFTEEDDEKEETDEIDENEKEKFTNIKYIINNIPILKENEFKNLEIELKPMIEKCEKYYNEYLNKQDSKEEIAQYKNETTTTTRKEKKIIGLGGKIIDKLNVSDSINTLNNDKEITNESIEINASMKRQLLDESDSIEKSYKFPDKEKLWKYFVKFYINQCNIKFKEYRQLILRALIKYQMTKKVDLRINKKENENDKIKEKKEKELKQNILNLEIKEKSIEDSNYETKRKKKRKKRINSEDEEEIEEKIKEQKQKINYKEKNLDKKENETESITNIQLIDKEPLINIMNENEIYSEIDLYVKQKDFGILKYSINEIETINTTTKVKKKKKKARNNSIVIQKINEKLINMSKEHEKSEKENIEKEKNEKEKNVEENIEEEEEYEEE